MIEPSEPVGSGGSNSEFILYQTDDRRTQIQVRLEGETAWLSQAQMADLFQTTKQNISLHIRNIFEEGELQEEAVVKEYLTTASDGKAYRVLHYTTSTSSSPSAIASKVIAAHSFASGRRSGFGNTSSRGSRWTTND